jgi:hypothetical protein
VARITHLQRRHISAASFLVVSNIAGSLVERP